MWHYFIGLTIHMWQTNVSLNGHINMSLTVGLTIKMICNFRDEIQVLKFQGIKSKYPKL